VGDICQVVSLLTTLYLISFCRNDTRLQMKLIASAASPEEEDEITSLAATAG